MYAKYDNLDLYEDDIVPEDILFDEQDILLQEAKKTLKCDSEGCTFEAKTVYLLEQHRLGKHT